MTPSRGVRAEYWHELNRKVEDLDQYYPPQEDYAPREDSVEPGVSAFYFSAARQTDTTVRVSNIRFRYGKSLGTYANISGGVDDYVDVTIPTTNGVYWVHFRAAYATSYTFTMQPGTVNQHPDQSDIDASTRAYREEVCKVTVASNVISSVDQIWSGGVLSIEGRIV